MNVCFPGPHCSSQMAINEHDDFCGAVDSFDVNDNGFSLSILHKKFLISFFLALSFNGSGKILQST